jgi:hypothetical protein
MIAMARGGGTPPATTSAQLLVYVCRYMKIGVWYDWDDVVKAVTPKVPRMAALRRGESEWARGIRKRTGHTPLRPHPNPEVAVKSGARILIRWSVDNVENTFEWRGERGHRQLRLLRVPHHVRDHVKKRPRREEESETG